MSKANKKIKKGNYHLLRNKGEKALKSNNNKPSSSQAKKKVNVKDQEIVVNNEAIVA